MKLNHKLALLLAGAVLAGSLTGCGASSAPASSAPSSEAAASSAVSEAASSSAESALPDGVYTADFDTDSSMFHANEANDGKGTLTVKDGQMTFHVSLVSKKIDLRKSRDTCHVQFTSCARMPPFAAALVRVRLRRVS